MCFRDTPPTVIYTLSLHDALPISRAAARRDRGRALSTQRSAGRGAERLPHARAAADDFQLLDLRFVGWKVRVRSEEHTSELQSLTNIVCRLLLEKKKHSTHVTYPV